ncbi:MAG TPA: polyphosphate polymerase domain-containing protein [Oscillospiraceae bacterium]|nr:polyphosphate polymerase domain-containing protein [Oscillospiraceae bacterium]
MAKNRDVFRRYEKKYILDEAQYLALRRALMDHMHEDEYGLGTVVSLYYDTADFTLIRASIERPVYKEKLRLRSYGTPNDSDTVFIELKKKYRGVVFKRRFGVSLEEARRYLAGGSVPAVSPEETQIVRETDWFLATHDVEPKSVISCDRRALVGNDDAELRITFDRSLRWRKTQLDLAFGDWGAPLLPGGTVMEIKTLGAMPLWLCELLSEVRAYPASISKYGLCYKEDLMGDLLPQESKGGASCA